MAAPAVAQWPRAALAVDGAYVISSPVYPDARGSLYESLHILKSPFNIAISSITGISPPRRVAYGPVAHAGDEYVYLIRGKLLAVVIDRSLAHRDSVILEPGKILRIPAGVAHAFLSLDDSTIFDCVRTDSANLPLDPNLTISWPESELPVTPFSASPERRIAPVRPEFAIMGSNGMIGGAFVRHLEASGRTWVQLRSRLHQQSSIRNELALIGPTVSVLIAAGVGTRPNTKWCEDHRVETIDANVTAQLAIASACRDLGLHVTLIGTCGFYHYDESHPLGSGVGFPEDAVPNHECNFYYAMRALLERLLNDTGLIGSVLNLRALFPFDHKVTSASLIGKLLRFARINCIPTSMTVLPDLVPLAVELMDGREVGHVNWVCEGVASNGDVLRAYRAIVDGSIAINEVAVAPADSRATGNSAAYVVPARLAARFGAERVPRVGDAIARLMELIKQDRAAK